MECTVPKAQGHTGLHLKLFGTCFNGFLPLYIFINIDAFIYIFSYTLVSVSHLFLCFCFVMKDRLVFLL